MIVGGGGGLFEFPPPLKRPPTNPKIVLPMSPIELMKDAPASSIESSSSARAMALCNSRDTRLVKSSELVRFGTMSP